MRGRRGDKVGEKDSSNQSSIKRSKRKDGLKLLSDLINTPTGTFRHGYCLSWLLPEEKNRRRKGMEKCCLLSKEERDRDREIKRKKEPEKLQLQQMCEGATEGSTSAAEHHPVTFSSSSYQLLKP